MCKYLSTWLSEFEMINFKWVIKRYHRRCWWRHGAHRIPARDEISHGSSRAPQMCHLYGWTSMWGPQKCPILRMENFNGGHIGIQYYVFFACLQLLLLCHTHHLKWSLPQIKWTRLTTGLNHGSVNQLFIVYKKRGAIREGECSSQRHKL